MTTKKTRPAAQSTPAYLKTMTKGEAKVPSALGLKERQGTIIMMAIRAPT